MKKILIIFCLIVLRGFATTNELIVDGNSLNIEPLNPGGPHGWVLVFPLPANCGKTNIAVSGANALEQINRMQADLTPNLDPACTHRVLHWMEIGNSIAHGSNDIQAFYSYTNYIHFARTNTPSIYIIAASSWSRGDLTNTLNTYRTNANQMVRTTWQQYADAFIDYDADPRLDYTLHPENFSGDLIHPVTSGVTAITNINMATILAAFNDIDTTIGTNTILFGIGDSTTAHDGKASWLFPYFTNICKDAGRTLLEVHNAAHNGDYMSTSGGLMDEWFTDVKPYIKPSHSNIGVLDVGANHDDLEVAGGHTNFIRDCTTYLVRGTNAGLRFAQVLIRPNYRSTNASFGVQYEIERALCNLWITTNNIDTWHIDENPPYDVGSLNGNTYYVDALHPTEFGAAINATNIFLAMTTNTGGGTVIGASASIPTLSSIQYWSFMGPTPADGSVQSINPPLFKWNYCRSSERNHPGEDQANRDLHVFRFQLSTNASFSPLQWDIYTSNNFENCLAPITNSDGTAWAGTNYWRIIYYDRLISTIQETDVVHHFTLAPGATNWDRGMLRDPTYLTNVTQYHPHMYFSTNSRTAFANYLRNTYTGPHAWLELSNTAIQSITNGLTTFVAPTFLITNWWNNEHVFTNLSNPQDTFPFIETAALIYQLDTNAFVISSNLPGMVDIACRWWVNTLQDRVPAYQELDYDGKALPVMIDWAWPLMNTAQRSNAVFALDCSVRFFVWEDWWCEGSAVDLTRAYAYTNRFINISSAAKYGDSHQRYDGSVGLTMAMACWADSTNIQSVFPYFINYYIGLYTEGRLDEGRGYSVAEFDGTRTIAGFFEAVFLFRAAQLERNPLMGIYLSQMSYFEPVNFYQIGDPWGDFGGMPNDYRPFTGDKFGTQSSLVYLQYCAKLLAIATGNGAALRQYNRYQSIYNSAVSSTPFTPLQDTGVNTIFSTPTETAWPSNDWVAPEQGYASMSSVQPNDFGAFTNGVTVWTSAFPGTKNEHGQIADGTLQMSAYGAQAIGGHVGDYMKHLMCNSGGIFVDGIGTVRFEGAPLTTNRAQFTAFTNSSDFAYLASDITHAYPMTNYTTVFLTNYNIAANFYQPATNSRPYLTSMKRHVLFPHRKYLVLYDTMTATQPANFQWVWHYLEPTGTVNTNGCSFTYTCTNFLNGSNVTVYVVPFANPASMTCTPLLSTNFSYTNIITGEHIGLSEYPDGNSQIYPLFNGNIWVQNTTASTNWHFGNVIYPRRWDEPAPTITRLDDLTVKVVGYTNDGSAYPGNWVQFTDTNTFDTNLTAFTFQVATDNAGANSGGGSGSSSVHYLRANRIIVGH